MTHPVGPAVVIDTMVVSAMMNAVRDPDTANDYRALVAGRPIVVSFVTVTEMRYGALKAGWGDLRRRGLERELAKLTVAQPDDELMHRCAELRSTCASAGKALGQKVHEADRWVAATAIMLAVELVSDDAVFKDISGLTVLTRQS